MTKHEFVIPLCDRLAENNLDDHDQTIQRGILPSKDNFLSVRPEMLKEEDIKNENQKLYLVPPKINLDYLKNYALNSFCDSVKIFSSHIRDPIGGSTSSLFVYEKIYFTYFSSVYVLNFLINKLKAFN